jgi:hypothetical protein
MLRSRAVSLLVGLWLATALVLTVLAVNAPQLLQVVGAPGIFVFERVVLPLLPGAFLRQLFGDFGEFAQAAFVIVSAILFWAIPLGIAWWFFAGRRGKHEKYAA